MFSKNRKRKNRKYLKFVSITFMLAGLLMLAVSFFILNSYLIFKNPVLSPIGKSFTKPENNFISLLKNAKINISGFSVTTDSSYMVLLVDNGNVIFDPSKNLDMQVRSLQIILSRLTIEGKRFKSLDFRFDKPVVSF